jgi:hypothetical protein
MCGCLNRLRSNRVHNNKNMGLAQPKRPAWWVRTALTFMLCSPTINFRCGNNPTISPVTYRAQLFHHMTIHVHNMEGYYRLGVQFSRHKDFRDHTETLTGGKSPFLTIQLYAKFGFGHRTSKPDIFDHPTVKTVQIWPSGGFDRRFSIFFIYNLVLRS